MVLALKHKISLVEKQDLWTWNIIMCAIHAVMEHLNKELTRINVLWVKEEVCEATSFGSG